MVTEVQPRRWRSMRSEITDEQHVAATMGRGADLGARWVGSGYGEFCPVGGGYGGGGFC